MTKKGRSTVCLVNKLGQKGTPLFVRIRKKMHVIPEKKLIHK